MGNGSVTSHRQIAAGVLGSRADQIEIINADTDLTPYDTGTFASTGTVVAGQAVALTAAALRDNILGSLRSRAIGMAARRRRRHPRERTHCARRSACGGQRGWSSLRSQAQGLSLSPHDRLQRARRAARAEPDHRRNPHPAQRPRGRPRSADQSHEAPGRSVRITLSLAFLAPAIVRAAVEGRLPYGVTASSFSELPIPWEEQLHLAS
jgi:CO/xanthine dehydrogenase Mo-binding subunit